MGCLVPITSLSLVAQTLTWTNFTSSPQAVGPVNNWSPNGTWIVGNAITAGAFDFQVDFPGDFIVTVQKATGTGSGLTFTLTNSVATIKMGDTNGGSAFTLGNGGANVARLSFPNGATIEKRGDGNDTISSSRMVVTSNLNVNFAGGSGTLMFNCTDGSKSIYAQETSPLPSVALNVSGSGTLILANQNDHKGGTFISQASVQFACG